MHKKIICSLIFVFIALSVFALDISTEWTQLNSTTGTILKKPAVIHIEPDSGYAYNNYYAIFSVVEGKGKVLTERVEADSTGLIKANFQTSEKMENNIYMAKVFYKDTLVKVFNYQVFGLKWLDIIFGIVGGLGLFLFGMKFMSDGLQKVAGDRMRSIISSLTRNTFFSVIMGLIVTSIIQSSSATTVMVVGFVNAGIMTLAQSIGVIMGANIGTTVTAQLIAFKLGDYALPAIALGVILILFTRKSKYKNWGEVLFGFGLLFLGMGMMSSTVHPLRKAPEIIEFFVNFSYSPILAMLTGIIITVIVQSSSATVGLTIVLASQGLIDIYGAVPLVLGENIGTTITASLAALSSNKQGKRAALVHGIFNIIGVTYMLLGFYFVKIRGVPAYLRLVDAITPGNNLEGENIARYVANSHTIFNIFNTLVFLPFVGILRRIVERIIPVREHDIMATELKTKYLDDNLLNNPAIALGQVKKEMRHMLNTARLSMSNATDVVLNDNEKLIEKVKYLERKTDFLQNAITSYIIKISREELFKEEAEQIPVYIHSINDIERIGDQAINLLEHYQTKTESNLVFSDIASSEIRQMNEILLDMIDIIDDNIERYDEEELERCFVLEERINENERIFANNHILRMQKELCDMSSNAVFADMLSTYEKAGDHVLNIAQAIYNKFEWGEK